jgi:hypothetical protein
MCIRDRCRLIICGTVLSEIPKVPLRAYLMDSLVELLLSKSFFSGYEGCSWDAKLSN